MESIKNHFRLSFWVVLTLTELANGEVLDDLLDNDEHLLYLAIGFLCFSVLFLFAVILMISVVIIRVQKLLEKRADRNIHHRNSETVIANPNAICIPMSDRRLTEPTRWDHYLPEIRSGSDLNTASNVDYQGYMDLIIMDANRVTLPRAKVEIGENTI